MNTSRILAICAVFALVGTAEARQRDPRPVMTKGASAVMTSCLYKKDSRVSTRNGKWTCCSVEMKACLVCPVDAADQCKVIRTDKKRR